MKKAFRVLFFVAVIYLIFQGGMLLLKGALFPAKYSNYVVKYSKEYDVNPMLVMSVMKAESNFNEDAQSKKDARGLMQITGSTGTWIAEQLGVKDFNVDMLKEPEVSIKFACWYLNNLDKEFKNENLVIAAYNAGRGNVKKWLNDNKYSKDGKNLNYIPFKETDKYVKKVNAYKNIYTSLYVKGSKFR
ncbi:lytic transglycosylase domain-containing protein [uncultured Clostridium sp.]|uniref:lytic transglycosylase domain-containing protein n=1 Tax=uncultured Clostridium sp. TaxID=59620 RepID=UPI0026244131|nr:lytic transglycosylase domain-containing protein [uncultured Clostridium sp.]